MSKHHAQSCASGSRLAGRVAMAAREVRRCTLHGLRFEARLRHEPLCPDHPCDCLPDEILVCPACPAPAEEG